MPFHGLFGNALFFGLGLPVIKTRLACQPASQCFSPVQNLVTFSKKHSHYATFFKTYLCFQQNSTFEAFYCVFYHLPIWVGVLLDESNCLYSMMRGLQPLTLFLTLSNRYPNLQQLRDIAGLLSQWNYYYQFDKFIHISLSIYVLSGIQTWDPTVSLCLNLKHCELDHSATTAGFFNVLKLLFLHFYQKYDQF